MNVRITQDLLATKRIVSRKTRLPRNLTSNESSWVNCISGGLERKGDVLFVGSKSRAFSKKERTQA